MCSQQKVVLESTEVLKISWDFLWGALCFQRKYVSEGLHSSCVCSLSYFQT